jgi:hypothetical protein
VAEQVASEPAIAALSEKAARVDSPDLVPSTPADELPMGASSQISPTESPRSRSPLALLPFVALAKPTNGES